MHMQTSHAHLLSPNKRDGQGPNLHRRSAQWLLIPAAHQNTTVPTPGPQANCCAVLSLMLPLHTQCLLASLLQIEPSLPPKLPC